jgi:hypothetical protein
MLPAEQQRAIQPALGRRFSTALRCRECAGPRLLPSSFVSSCLRALCAGSCLQHTPPQERAHLLVQDHISPQPPHPLWLGSHARGHAVSAAIFQEQPRGQAEGNLRPIHSRRTASR